MRRNYIVQLYKVIFTGGSHELHPGGSGQPGIIVHVCETANPLKAGPRIQHTRCPEHS